ncbi:MAG: GFA family protein [Proteobacteria bacterium]|nr:GFA family protein [Pseudomonadota bacterium]
MAQQRLSGSCLCGKVTYEAVGEPQRFYFCHCSRCRKASGSAHAANIFLQPGTLRFLTGENQIRKFRVPEAQRFANHFCSDCGARLPRSGGADTIVIPAGSLNTDAPIEPQARIFMGSRASWSCHGDSVPCFDELPTG